MNWYFWTVVLEKTLESPLDWKEIQSVHPKGDQSWVFIGGTDVEAETPILWPPATKSWLIGKDTDAGKDWGQEEKGMTEDKMVGWHYWLDGHGFGWTLGGGDEQGGLACCGSWSLKESYMTERLNWTDLKEGPCIYILWGWAGLDLLLRLLMIFSSIMHGASPKHAKLNFLESGHIEAFGLTLNSYCCIIANQPY